MQLTKPIVVIGAGRSGTTLLDRMLDAHPEIHMVGETRFMIPTLWEALWAGSDGSLWSSKVRLSNYLADRILAGELGGRRATPEILEKLEMDEKMRVGRIILQAVADLFELQKVQKRYWGMKEIWNGARRRFDWAIYDHMFPDALWIHLVRNPFHYARSNVDWGQNELNGESLAHQLTAWKQICEKSRERQITGRFIEIRYEDLITTPEATLKPVLGKLGIPWKTTCLEPLRRKWVTTRNPSPFPILDLDAIAASVGVKELASALGYTTPKPGTIGERGLDDAISYDDAGRILLRPPFTKWKGYCWVFDFSTSPAIRDMWNAILEKPRGTMVLRLFEDSRPLGPHEPSAESILTDGRGLYMTSEHALIFSTSDNSDPNCNGRIYSIEIPG